MLLNAGTFSLQVTLATPARSVGLVVRGHDQNGNVVAVATFSVDVLKAPEENGTDLERYRRTAERLGLVVPRNFQRHFDLREAWMARGLCPEFRAEDMIAAMAKACSCRSRSGFVTPVTAEKSCESSGGDGRRPRHPGHSRTSTRNVRLRRFAHRKRRVPRPFFWAPLPSLLFGGRSGRSLPGFEAAARTPKSRVTGKNDLRQTLRMDPTPFILRQTCRCPHVVFGLCRRSW